MSSDSTKGALSLMLSLWHCALSTAFIFRIRQKNLASQLYKSVLIATLTMFISGIFVFFINFIGVVYFNNWSASEHSSGAFTLLIIYIISFNIMQGAAYLFVFLLMYNSLQSSVYAMTAYHKSIHFFFLFIMSLAAISSMILQHYFRYTVASHITTAIGLVFYVIGIFDIMYFLSESLFKLVSNIDQKKAFFISRITKLTVLTMLFLICIMVFIMAKVFVAIYPTSIVMNIIQWFIYLITEIVGTLSIFNVFAVNEKCYLFCCHKCDKQIGELCHNVAKKNIERMQEHKKKFKSDSNYVSPAKEMQNSTQGLVNILYDDENAVTKIGDAFGDGDDKTNDTPAYADHRSYVL